MKDMFTKGQDSDIGIMTNDCELPQILFVPSYFCSVLNETADLLRQISPKFFQLLDTKEA